MQNIAGNNLNARDAWNANARFWDEQMGEGNEFFNVLVWPAVERLLPVKSGERILDIACGNGLTSRRLFRLGARVVAIDFSETLVNIAMAREYGKEIDYRIIDVTNHESLMDIGNGEFDAALCNMALMDIADIDPLIKALAKMLRTGGAFVFSILHPCFNNPSTIQMAELEDREGSFEMTYSIKVSRYLTPYTRLGAAMPEQPVPHPYFHRSLHALIPPILESGFVLDGLEERAFSAGYPAGKTAVSWSGAFSEIPPVLVVRMRRNR
jgi:2-polyprenyl-3-methyl-5-hydroxy-6-metoxy-1,4-benzoquinol methylase